MVSVNSLLASWRELRGRRHEDLRGGASHVVRAQASSWRAFASHWSMRLDLLSRSPRTSLTPPAFNDVWEHLSVDSWRRLKRNAIAGRLATYGVLPELTSELIRACFADFPNHTRYLPAARSGLMQSHRALAGSLVRGSVWAGLREMSIPAMSGVVADFLGEMVELDTRQPGPARYQEIAASLEREVLQGNLSIEGEPDGPAEFVYRSQQGDFPLGQTSSMVSEVAPIVVYLRYLLRRGDLLMIGAGGRISIRPLGQASETTGGTG